MRSRKNFACVLILALLTVLLWPSCEKDKITTYRFTFSKEGGPLLYTLDIDGSSISLNADGVQAKPAVFVEDYADRDNCQWFTESDWIRVYYTPFKFQLFVSVDSNELSKEREATIICYGDDGMEVRIFLRQK